MFISDTDCQNLPSSAGNNQLLHTGSGHSLLMFWGENVAILGRSEQRSDDFFPQGRE